MIARALLPFLLLPLACASAPAPGPAAPEPEGPRVVSYRLAGTDRYNAGIEAAVSEGKHWPRSALRIVSQYFAGPEEAGRVTLRKVDGPGESPGETTVTVVEEGLRDDSTAGRWYEFRLVRTTEGYWRIREIRTANRCARGAEQRDVYGENPCP